MLERISVRARFTYEQLEALKNRMRKYCPGNWEEGRMYTIRTNYLIKNKKIIGEVYDVTIYPGAINSYYPGQIEHRTRQIEQICAEITEGV